MKTCSQCGRQVPRESTVYIPATGLWFCNFTCWNLWTREKEIEEADPSEDWKKDKNHEN